MKIVAGLLVFLVSQSNRNQFWFLLEVSVLVSAQPLLVLSNISFAFVMERTFAFVMEQILYPLR